MSGSRKRRRRRSAAAGPLLSVCMVVRNEATRLPKCLESIQALKPELIVVDTGSTDGTQEVARSFGARLIDFPWQDDFSAARNRSLEEARGRWILVLDADELIDPEDLGRMKKLLSSPQASAYRFVSRNYSRASDLSGWQPCSGQYPEHEAGMPGWFPTSKVRLFRRHPAVRFEGLVHESVAASIERLKGKVASCPVPIHHFGLIDEALRLSKSRYYLRLVIRKLRQEPDDADGWFELASHLFELKRILWAEGAYGRCVELAEAKALTSRAHEAVYLKALNMLGVFALRRGDMGGALKYFDRALEVSPSFAPCKLNRQEALKRLGPDVASHPKQASAKSGPAVSLCMIVKDEEADLPSCLESFGPVADQIVVVDTGSTDATVAVAESYGAEVYHHRWEDDFSKARNWSLSYARGRMILWVDADDRLEPGAAEAVRRELLDHEGKALYFVIRSPEPGGLTLRAHQLRAFPNRPDVRFEGRIHEQVIWAVQNLRIPTVHLPLEIVHTGYSNGEALRQKLHRNRSILEEQLRLKPEDIHAQYMMARTLEGLGERDEAAEWLRRLIEHPRANVERNEFVFHAQSLLAAYHSNRGELEVGRALLEELIKKAPDFAFGRLCLGQLELNTGHPLEACKVLMPLVEKELKPSLIPMGNPVQEAYRFIGAALMDLGQWGGAKDCLLKALELDGGDEEARFRLGDCLFQEGHLEEAEETFSQCDESNPNVNFKLGTVALGLDDLPKAEEHLSRAAQRGLDTAPFHHNFGFLMAKRGLWERAEHHYRLALEREPEMVEPLLNMGHGLLHQGRWREAEGYFLQALDLQPERIEAKLAAAALAFERGGPEAQGLFGELWRELAPEERREEPFPSHPTELFHRFGRLFENQGESRLSSLCQILAVSITS